MLPLFGRLTDGVHETHFRTGKPCAERLREPPDFFNRLRGLRHDAETWSLHYGRHLIFIQHDIALGQIFRQAAHFDMVTLADDDRVKPLAHHLFQAAVSQVNQRTRRFDHLQPAIPDFSQLAIRSAMRGDHHQRRGHGGRLAPKLDALRPQPGQHGFVVDQVAEDGQRLVGRFLHGQRDGVTNAKAHAKIFSAENFHNFYNRLCDAK